MKKLLTILFMMSFCFKLLAESHIDQYSHIKIRKLPDVNTNLTKHAGIIFRWKSPVRLGVFGAIKKDTRYEQKKYGYEKLGEIEMSVTGVGATINLGFEEDNVFTINNLEGSELEQVCGNYYGLRAGLSIWIGGTGFTTVNQSGVILRSNATSGGVRGDISAIKVRVRCLDQKNRNWKKIVRF